MLDQLEVDAAGKTGCAHAQCQLTRKGLLQELVKRHGNELGARLCTGSFDCGHEASANAIQFVMSCWFCSSIFVFHKLARFQSFVRFHSQSLEGLIAQKSVQSAILSSGQRNAGKHNHCAHPHVIVTKPGMVLSGYPALMKEVMEDVAPVSKLQDSCN